MNAIKHKTYWKLQKYKNWFLSEANKHPKDRDRRKPFIDNQLKYLRWYVEDMYEEFFMATKKKTKAFVFKGYVNINIPESATNELEKYIQDEKEVFMDIAKTFTENYTAKCRYDGEKDSFICTLTCYDDSSANFGHVISAFAGDWYTAMAVCIWKHRHLTHGDWDDFKSSITRAYG